MQYYKNIVMFVDSEKNHRLHTDKKDTKTSTLASKEFKVKEARWIFLAIASA